MDSNSHWLLALLVTGIEQEFSFGSSVSYLLVSVSFIGVVILGRKMVVVPYWILHPSGHGSVTRPGRTLDVL